MQQVTVRVPASTSNLGPGYDCLGVALRLHNSVTLVRGKTPSSSHPRIVSDAAERFFNQARYHKFSFSFSIAEQVPRCRGLGGSATVRLGILLGLNRLSAAWREQLAWAGQAARMRHRAALRRRVALIFRSSDPGPRNRNRTGAKNFALQDIACCCGRKLCERMCDYRGVRISGLQKNA